MASETNLGIVLVIGGCGYLGSNLVTVLKSGQSCTAIHVMSRNPTTNIQPNVTYHSGDIASQTDVTSILEKINPSVIFHTASPKYTASEKALWHTNINGTRTLLKCAAKSKIVKAFIYTSSDSTLLQNPGVLLTEETCSIHNESSTSNAYAKTKAIADSEVRAANDPPTLLTAVLRVPSLWGENDDNSMAALLSMVKNKQTKMQIGENKNKFEFCYTPKACEAHVLAAKALIFESSSSNTAAKEKVNGEAFFISDGEPVAYFDFARKVFAFAGHPVDVKEVNVMPYLVVLWFAVLGEWFTWAYSFGRKTPEVRQKGIEYLAGGTEWDITKAKERLGYVPLEDRDVVLKRVTEGEAQRLGVE